MAARTSQVRAGVVPGRTLPRLWPIVCIVCVFVWSGSEVFQRFLEVDWARTGSKRASATPSVAPIRLRRKPMAAGPVGSPASSVAGFGVQEWDPWARHGGGGFRHGRRAQSARVETIGGRPVRSTGKGAGRYGRGVGTVFSGDRDIREWPVREDLATAAYGRELKDADAAARTARRRMLRACQNFDPHPTDLPANANISGWADSIAYRYALLVYLRSAARGSAGEGDRLVQRASG